MSLKLALFICLGATSIHYMQYENVRYNFKDNWNHITSTIQESRVYNWLKLPHRLPHHKPQPKIRCYPTCEPPSYLDDDIFLPCETFECSEDKPSDVCEIPSPVDPVPNTPCSTESAVTVADVQKPEMLCDDNPNSMGRLADQVGENFNKLRNIVAENKGFQNSWNAIPESWKMNIFNIFDFIWQLTIVILALRTAYKIKKMRIRMNNIDANAAHNQEEMRNQVYELVDIFNKHEYRISIESEKIMSEIKSLADSHSCSC